MGILILLVIATIVITGVFVGYNAWEASLHEEVEKHSESTRIEIFHEDKFEQYEDYFKPHQYRLIK